MVPAHVCGIWSILFSSNSILYISLNATHYQAVRNASMDLKDAINARGLVAPLGSACWFLDSFFDQDPASLFLSREKNGSVAASIVHGSECLPVSFAKTTLVASVCDAPLAPVPPLKSTLLREPLQQEISRAFCGSYNNGNATLLLDRTRTFLAVFSGIVMDVVLFEWRELANKDVCVGIFIRKTQQVIYSRWSHSLVHHGRGTIQETNSLCFEPKSTVQHVVREHNECHFSISPRDYLNSTLFSLPPQDLSVVRSLRGVYLSKSAWRATEALTVTQQGVESYVDQVRFFFTFETCYQLLSEGSNLFVCDLGMRLDDKSFRYQLYVSVETSDKDKKRLSSVETRLVALIDHSNDTSDFFRNAQPASFSLHWARRNILVYSVEHTSPNLNATGQPIHIQPHSSQSPTARDDKETAHSNERILGLVRLVTVLKVALLLVILAAFFARC